MSEQHPSPEPDGTRLDAADQHRPEAPAAPSPPDPAPADEPVAPSPADLAPSDLIGGAVPGRPGHT